MKATTMTDLPTLPSALLTLALADLAAVEADPRYVVDMDFWHEGIRPGNNAHCHVCLAGAVLAKTVGLKLSESFRYASPDDDPALLAALSALNALRLGWVSQGCKVLGYEVVDLPNIEVELYENDPAAFRRDLTALAARLREAGL